MNKQYFVDTKKLFNIMTLLLSADRKGAIEFSKSKILLNSKQDCIYEAKVNKKLTLFSVASLVFHVQRYFI